jgi:hypothetical protein
MKVYLRCAACDLRQFEAKNCRRCGHPIRKGLAFFAADVPLPTLEEGARILVEEAIRRCKGSRLRAAKMLGIGKTTLFRWTTTEGKMKTQMKRRIAHYMEAKAA